MVGEDVETVKYCVVVGWSKELGQLLDGHVYSRDNF